MNPRQILHSKHSEKLLRRFQRNNSVRDILLFILYTCCEDIWWIVSCVLFEKKATLELFTRPKWSSQKYFILFNSYFILFIKFLQLFMFYLLLGTPNPGCFRVGPLPQDFLYFFEKFSELVLTNDVSFAFFCSFSNKFRDCSISRN